jgi:hypothetical protein
MQVELLTAFPQVEGMLLIIREHGQAILHIRIPKNRIQSSVFITNRNILLTDFIFDGWLLHGLFGRFCFSGYHGVPSCE